MTFRSFLESPFVRDIKLFCNAVVILAAFGFMMWMITH